MRDVIYYVGHGGIEADFPACNLQVAAMYDLEVEQNELRAPDFVIDVTETAEINFKSILCAERAKVFGRAGGRQCCDKMHTWGRFWGMRHGVTYAEPMWYSYGSMAMMDPCRNRDVLEFLPALP